MCHRTGPGRPAGGPTSRGLGGAGGRPRSRPGPLPTRREGRGRALRGPRRRWSRRGRAGAVEGIRWPWCGPGVLGGRRLLQPAGGAGGTAWPATGPQSWTSASASSTCHGTTTTRRNSTSGSPDRTDRVATTPGMKWTASTTHRATFGGRSDAISSTSSTRSPERRSIPNH